MTLTASNVTAEDKAALSVPQRTWQVELQLKLQRLQLHAMGDPAHREHFSQQEINLLVNVMRERNRSKQ